MGQCASPMTNSYKISYNIKFAKSIWSNLKRFVICMTINFGFEWLPELCVFHLLSIYCTLFFFCYPGFRAALNSFWPTFYLYFSWNSSRRFDLEKQFCGWLFTIYSVLDSRLKFKARNPLQLRLPINVNIICLPLWDQQRRRLYERTREEGQCALNGYIYIYNKCLSLPLPMHNKEKCSTNLACMQIKT